jgi:hypothetical protein
VYATGDGGVQEAWWILLGIDWWSRCYFGQELHQESRSTFAIGLVDHLFGLVGPYICIYFPFYLFFNFCLFP